VPFDSFAYSRNKWPPGSELVAAVSKDKEETVYSGLGRVGDEESTGVKGAAVGDTKPSISYEASLKNAFRMPGE
jgi:hypothetical protein